MIPLPPLQAPQASQAQQSKLAPATPGPLVPRICMYAVPGFGKTTTGANTPDPYILMGRTELGYMSLLSAERVPAVPAIEIVRWGDLMLLLTQFAQDTKGRRTLVLDSLGSFERLCHEYVCANEFNNDWGKRGFLHYQRGYDVGASEWCKMLRLLSKIHQRDVIIVLLAHSRVVTFKNPFGPDYDRFVPRIHEKTWWPTNEWCDTVLFGKFLTVMDNEQQAQRSGKGKAVGGKDHIVYTDYCDGYDAKNCYGMESEIQLDGGPGAAWTILWNAIIGKEKNV